MILATTLELVKKSTESATREAKRDIVNMNALPINIFLYLYIGGVPHHRGVYWHIAWQQTIPLGPQPICCFCSTYLGGVQPRNPKYHLLNGDACFPCTYALQIQRYTLGL